MSNAVERAYAAIRDDIRAGHYAPGTHLKEGDLADRIGVSRTPVREALRRLNADGAVRFVRNQGAFVAEWSAEDVADIFELRSLLEGHAAERAASRCSPSQLARLRQLAEEMIELEAKRPSDFRQRIAQANAEFHRLIIEAAASQRLISMMAHVVEIPLVLRTFQRYSPEALRRSLHHHLEIVAALEVGDAAWARSVMQSHIAAAGHAIDVSGTVSRDTAA